MAPSVEQLLSGFVIRDAPEGGSGIQSQGIACSALDSRSLALRASGMTGRLFIYLAAAVILHGCSSVGNDGPPEMAAEIVTRTVASKKAVSKKEAPAPPVVADRPTSLDSMRGAVSAALDYSSSVRHAGSQLALSGVNIDIARAGYQPTLQGSAGGIKHSAYRNLGLAGLPDFQFTVSQPLYDWGKTDADVGRAHAESEAAGLELSAEREKTALEAAQAYISVKRNEALVRAAQDNLAAHERFTQLAKERAKGGVGDHSEVELAGVRQSEAASELENVNGLLRNARSIFLSKVGYEPKRLADIPDLNLALGDITDVRAEASLAPAASAALAKGRAAEHAVASAKAELFPKLTAEGFVRQYPNNSYANSQYPYTRTTDAGVGLRLVAPTFVGLSNFKRVEAAHLQADSAQWAAETAVRKAVEDVRAFQDKAPTLRSQATILEAQLRKAKALRKLYEDQFLLGERTLIDLASVQGDVYRIERNGAEARYAISDLQYSAASALGRLLQLLDIAAEEPQR